jgi:hypothetical protein
MEPYYPIVEYNIYECVEEQDGKTYYQYLFGTSIAELAAPDNVHVTIFIENVEINSFSAGIDGVEFLVKKEYTEGGNKWIRDKPLPDDFEMFSPIFTSGSNRTRAYAKKKYGARWSCTYYIFTVLKQYQ